VTTAPATGLRKAAILMVTLGEDAASEIYKYLPQAEVEQITQEITTISYVEPEAGLAVLE
jgi:flagellar motor switch protein FliG